MGHTPFFDLNVVSSYSGFKVRGEDIASILINRYTFYPLVFISVWLSAMQLVGKSIECWCPAQTTDAQCNYTKFVCWISGVYIIDHDLAIPNSQALKEEISSKTISFYPFIPFYLLLTALLFKIPTILWNTWQAEDGFDLNRMIKSVASCLFDEEEKAELVASNIDIRLRSRHCRRRRSGPLEAVAEWISATGVFVLGSRSGTYQTGLFLLTRLLNVVVVALVYPLLSRFLEADYAAWGWYMLRVLIGLEEEAEGTEASSVFQRETLCDFRIRQLQNVHDYTVQCLMPLNLWNEKIFLVLWLWLPVLLVASVFCYQDWWRKLVRQGGRRAFVRKHLRIGVPSLKQATEVFAARYVDADTVLILRKMELVAGVQFTSLVVKHLWLKYHGRVEGRLTD